MHRAQALILLGKETGESSATAEGRLTAQHAAAIETPNPVQRLTARHFYANVCVEAGWLEDASLSYRESVRLLGQLPRWASELQEREGALARFNGLSSDAAATEILRDDVNSALAILDAGRGILLARATDYRRQVADVARVRPDLASKLDAVRAALDVIP